MSQLLVPKSRAISRVTGREAIKASPVFKAAAITIRGAAA
jgi:hypothetical protein